MLCDRPEIPSYKSKWQLLVIEIVFRRLSFLYPTLLSEDPLEYVEYRRLFIESRSFFFDYQGIPNDNCSITKVRIGKSDYLWIACLMYYQKLLNRVSHRLPSWTLVWFAQFFHSLTDKNLVYRVNRSLLTVWLISMIFERIFPSLIWVRIFGSSSVAIRCPVQRRDTAIFTTSFTYSAQNLIR